MAATRKIRKPSAKGNALALEKAGASPPPRPTRQSAGKAKGGQRPSKRSADRPKKSATKSKAAPAVATGASEEQEPEPNQQVMDMELVDLYNAAKATVDSQELRIQR